jgi:hypothetical protein
VGFHGVGKLGVRSLVRKLDFGQLVGEFDHQLGASLGRGE